MKPNRFLALFLALALTVALCASSLAVNPKAEKELADVAAGVTGTCSTFVVTALAAGDTLTLLGAPGAGLHYQFIWFDWMGTSAASAIFGVQNQPSGTVLYAGKSGVTTTAVNNFKPNVLINLGSNKAFQLKNLEGVNALDMRFNARWIVVND